MIALSEVSDYHTIPDYYKENWEKRRADEAHGGYKTQL
jgi:hypothetical protein